MKHIHPLFVLPVAAAGFLVGKLFGKKKHSRAPLTDVPFAAWESFVAVMTLAPKDHVSKRGKLGTFQMDARKLKDAGVMKTAVKGSFGDEQGVWIGAWTTPLTEKAFLGNMPLQYAAFVRSMRAAAPKVSGFVGAVVDGKPCTLSGLLGVSHVAGEAGVKSWVAEPSVRKRFSGTTKMFDRTNGIF